MSDWETPVTSAGATGPGRPPRGLWSRLWRRLLCRSNRPSSASRPSPPQPVPSAAPVAGSSLRHLDPIRLRIAAHPVVYHVTYSDYTYVGPIKRRRNRAYVYRSDHDFLRRDWERAATRQGQNYPVVFNRSMVQGSSLAMKLRSLPGGRRRGGAKPAKIRDQRIKILAEYPTQPHRRSVYEIRQRSAHPSVVHQRRADRRADRHALRGAESSVAAPPLELIYQPMFV